jgi:cobalamin biosynthesis protein CobD/CbiB
MIVALVVVVVLADLVEEVQAVVEPVAVGNKIIQLIIKKSSFDYFEGAFLIGGGHLSTAVTMVLVIDHLSF